MSSRILIEDDPTHPEGGYARVVVRGIALPAARATLLIEPLTEGFDYRGPQRVESPVSPTGDGVELRLGPEVVGALKQGLAVHLGLEDTGKGFDVLWPELTPPRAAPRRSALSSGKPKRRVATEDGPQQPSLKVTPPIFTPPVFTPPIVPTAPAVQTAPAVDEAPPRPRQEQTTFETVAPPDAAKATMKDPDAPSADREASERGRATHESIDRKPEKASGWSLPRVAAIGAVAFGAGAGSIALLAWPKPPPVPAFEAKTDAALPSPFAMLDDLPSRSPDGTEVKASESAQFRERGEHASSPAEAAFWRRWAMRALLESHASNAAAVLDDFATTFASSSKSDGSVAVARFIWELAAVGNDCAAMDNIVAALNLPGAANAPDAIAAWQKRADACRKHATSTR